MWAPCALAKSYVQDSQHHGECSPAGHQPGLKSKNKSASCTSAATQFETQRGEATMHDVQTWSHRMEKDWKLNYHLIQAHADCQSWENVVATVTNLRNLRHYTKRPKECERQQACTGVHTWQARATPHLGERLPWRVTPCPPCSHAMSDSCHTSCKHVCLAYKTCRLWQTGIPLRNCTASKTFPRPRSSCSNLGCP